MSSATPRRIGILGPRGTFTEQALATQTDLADGELVLYRTMPDVLDAVEVGDVDLGFIAIENSIEGTVNLSQDELAFSHDLLIQREVVLDIEHCLLALPGTSLADVVGVDHVGHRPVEHELAVGQVGLRGEGLLGERAARPEDPDPAGGCGSAHAVEATSAASTAAGGFSGSPTPGGGP